MKILFLLLCVVASSSPVQAQIYALSKVTSVEDGGLYVFEIKGRVLGNIISSKGALQTIDSYDTSNLKGTEIYVWKLEQATGGYYMRNMGISGTNCYLNNSSGNLLGFGGKSSKWTFSFTNDTTAIQLSDSRYIADIGVYSYPEYMFRLYVQSNADKAFHHFIVYQLVSSFSASISSAEYATFSSPYALDFSGEEGLKVFTAGVNDANTKVILREVTNKLVPANTAVVLHGAEGTYTGTIIAEADALTGNELHVATEEMSGAGQNIYVLNKKNGVVGFYLLSDEGTLEQGKAYLTLNRRAPMLSLSEDGEATAVRDLPLQATTGSGVCYTLDGRRVTHPAKGVFIQNGKKIVIR